MENKTSKQDEGQKINVLDKKIFQTIKKVVPFIEGAFIVFYKDLFGKEFNLDAKDDIARLEIGKKAVINLIADWNFYNESDDKIKISEESFNKLSIKLQKWIVSQANIIISNISNE